MAKRERQPGEVWVSFGSNHKVEEEPVSGYVQDEWEWNPVKRALVEDIEKYAIEAEKGPDGVLNITLAPGTKQYVIPTVNDIPLINWIHRKLMG